MRYFDNDDRSCGSDDDPGTVDPALSTCFLQAIQRELIRLGYLKPAGLIERQLACVARAPEWWRRQRKGNRKTATPASAG
jgi:hypothetical protein